MRRPAHSKNHSVAPKNWRQTPNITGDYEMDCSIMNCRNPSLAGKLQHHVLSDAGAYGERTGYSGYHGYKGDD